jgi:orotate phosphoribosyltransferase
VAEEAFNTAGVELITVSNYQAVVEAALKSGYIKEERVPILQAWRQNPAEWGK